MSQIAEALRDLNAELDANKYDGVPFLERKVECCTCGARKEIGDVLEANGFEFCPCCWLELNRLGNCLDDDWVTNGGIWQQIYIVTGPLLPGKNPDSEQISVNIAADTHAIEAETPAIAEETHGIDTVSQVTNPDPLAVGSNITDITEAMEHEPPGDFCIDAWTGPDTDGTYCLGDPDSIMDDAASDPYAATDDSGTVPDDTMHNHEQAPPPSLPSISKMFACHLPSFDEVRAVIPFNEVRAVIPFNEVRAVIPFNEVRAVVPFDEVRAVVPFDEVRAVVQMGCLHVNLKYGPQNVLIGITITEQGNTTYFDLNDPSARLPWCIMPLLEPQTEDKQLMIEALLNYFRTGWVTRTQAVPRALEMLCQLTELIGGKTFEFGGRRYYSDRGLLKMTSSTDTDSTIVIGTLGLLESACKLYPDLNIIRDVLVMNMYLAVVNTKKQEAGAKKDPTVFCEFTSTDPNRKVYFIVRGKQHCQ